MPFYFIIMKGILNQIETVKTFKYKKFTIKDLTKVMRILDNTSARNRRKALNENRKNRWSKETREKYRKIAEEKWLEKQKDLIKRGVV